MGAVWQTPHFIICVFYIAGSWQEDTLLPLPHPMVKTKPGQICKAGCPRSKCGVPFSQHQHSFDSGVAVPCLHNAGGALVKQFPPGADSVGGSNEALWPGLEPPTAPTPREQRVATDPRASPLVTKQHGVWNGPVTSSSPHVLMGASANAESRNTFLSGFKATFATQNRQPLLVVKNKLFSPRENVPFHLTIWSSQMFLSSWWLLGHNVLLT